MKYVILASLLITSPIVAEKQTEPYVNKDGKIIIPKSWEQQETVNRLLMTGKLKEA